jgi:hypothetical protein
MSERDKLYLKLKAFVEKGEAMQKAVDKIIANTARKPEKHAKRGPQVLPRSYR